MGLAMYESTVRKANILGRVDVSQAMDALESDTNSIVNEAGQPMHLHLGPESAMPAETNTPAQVGTHPSC